MASSAEDEITGGGSDRALAAVLAVVVGGATALAGHWLRSKWRDGQPIGACSCCERQVLARDAKYGASTCAKCGVLVCMACRHSNPLTEAFPDSVWSQGICLCPACRIDMETLLQRARAIDVFSARYEGKTPLDCSRATAMLQSDFFDSQDEAELHLRLLAAEQGLELVVRRQYESRQQQDGNYIFKAWRASGLAGRRLI
ncbi:hypothetical protein LMG8323_04184 [Ralstonia mannitolilytica]|nr:hypothetical protein LMG8323_04184 [Ralstonia mannitolilytica]